MKHENEIVGNAGAVFNSINKAQIEGIKIPLPSLSEQQEIVSILDDAFESIDRAKSNAELNLKNAKELILSSTIKYFNCLDSVEFLNLEDLTDIITDYVANGSFASLAANVKYKREKDYAVLLRLLDNSRLYQGDFVYINEQAYEFLSKSKIYPNDIIISNVGARLGTVFRAPDIGMPMSLGPNSVLIRSKIYGDYLFCWLASPSGQKAIKDIVAGAGQPKFNKTQFRKIQVPVPKDKKSQQLVIDSINQLTNKAEKLEEIYLKKIKYLEDLKKAVLQKAFNGELKTSKISA
jgi:type I restriction enzyme S subunit